MGFSFLHFSSSLELCILSFPAISQNNKSKLTNRQLVMAFWPHFALMSTESAMLANGGLDFSSLWSTFLFAKRPKNRLPTW